MHKTRVVLAISRNTQIMPGGTVPFEQDDVAEGGVAKHLLHMDRDVWEDMGSPDVITVTIRPGNKLNKGV